MGEIVTAFGVCHSPHLLTRPPDEILEQSEASIAAMRELGKLLDETKPDVILFLGSDHLETFSMSCIPTFAIIAGDRIVAVRAIPYSRTGKKLEVPIKKILRGADPDAVASPGALLDPGALDAFVAYYREQVRG